MVAAVPPGVRYIRELILRIKDFRADTTVEVTRLPEQTRRLTWDADGRGFYTGGYNFRTRQHEVRFHDLESEAEPTVVAGFEDVRLEDISADGAFVLFERQLTPYGQGPSYLQELVLFDVAARQETILVTAWDFILARFVGTAHRVLVAHPTFPTETPPPSIYDWEVRHRLLDAASGAVFELPYRPGTVDNYFTFDLHISD